MNMFWQRYAARLGVAVLMAGALSAFSGRPTQAIQITLTEEDYKEILRLSKDKTHADYEEFIKDYVISHRFDPFERLIVFTPFLELVGIHLQTKQADGSFNASQLDFFKRKKRIFLQVDTVGDVPDFHRRYMLVLRQEGKVVQVVKAMRVPTRISKLEPGYPKYKGIFLLYYGYNDIDFSKPATVEVLRGEDKPTVYSIDWSKYK